MVLGVLGSPLHFGKNHSINHQSERRDESRSCQGPTQACSVCGPKPKEAARPSSEAPRDFSGFMIKDLRIFIGVTTPRLIQQIPLSTLSYYFLASQRCPRFRFFPELHLSNLHGSKHAKHDIHETFVGSLVSPTPPKGAGLHLRL